ncbi:hypothetical protein [Lacinutrix chionoecetis]
MENENAYIRNGKIAGLQGNKRRYRLKILGFSKERLQALNKVKSRLSELNKNYPKSKDLGLER